MKILYTTRTGLIVIILGLLTGAIAVLSVPKHKVGRPSPAVTAERILYFEENRGQAEPGVRMFSRSRGAFVQLHADGISVLSSALDPTAVTHLKMQWIGGNPAPALLGVSPTQGQSNYFVGDRPAAWVQSAAHYSEARYREIYPGIDLSVHATSATGAADAVEYDFIVEPGGDPSRIRLKFSGIDNYELNGQGNLVLRTGANQLVHRAPIAYQLNGDEKQYVATAYRLVTTSPLLVAFTLSAYDKTRDLIIDPVIEYGRFFGGNQEDEILSIAVDKDGYVYMTGETSSPNLTLVGGRLPHPDSVFQTKGNTLAFVAKLDPTGKRLIYCTYLGGSKTAVGHNLKIDAAGNAYVGGRTEASDFPLLKPVQAKFGGGSDDGFITKLNPAGNALVYSTYLGGSEYDQGRALAVDSAGNAYLTGITESANFPLMNPIQAKYSGKQDSFVLKLNPEGSAIVYSTYLGGAGDDVGHAVAVDATGSAYVTGLSNSPDFPVVNPFQRSFRAGEGDDTIVVKVNPAGNAFAYSTFVGGSKDDEARSIAVDDAGSAVVAGYTQSSDFPLAKALQAKFGGGSHDVFVFSLQPDGGALNWATFLGGSGGDFGRGLVLDASGNVLLTGYTDSRDFPVKNPWQSNYAGGTADVFYAKLNSSAQTLLLSSFLGGAAYERGRGMAAGVDGKIYISGRTESMNFPVTKSHSPEYGGGPNDAFIVRISER